MKFSLKYIDLQKKLIYVLFFSQFLYLISLGSVGTFQITVPFLCLLLFILVSSAGAISGKIKISTNRLLLFIVLFFTFLISCVANKYNSNYLSLMLHIFYFVSFVLVDKRQTEKDYTKLIYTFLIVITLCGFYGIYQFFAQNFIHSLPFKEIIPQALWTEGYNTFQNTHTVIFGRTILKPHSIYAEASGLSKYSAIALSLLLDSKYRKKNWILLAMVNAISLVLSLSGTGLIILMIVVVFKLFSISGVKKIYLFVGVIAVIILFFSLESSSIFSYYKTRMGEFSGSNTSAYYRFVLPFKIGIESIGNNFFGYGLGNDDIAYSIYNATETSISNGYGKIFVEMGIVGFIEFLVFIKTQVLTSKHVQNDIKVFSLIVLTLAVVGNYVSPVFWANVLFLMVIKNQKSRQ